MPIEEKLQKMIIDKVHDDFALACLAMAKDLTIEQVKSFSLFDLMIYLANQFEKEI